MFLSDVQVGDERMLALRGGGGDGVLAAARATEGCVSGAEGEAKK